MRYPRFWRDKGHANDAIVQVCIITALLVWLGLAWKLRVKWLYLAALPLGLVSGFIVGIALICLLSTLCRRNDRK